MRSRIRVLCEYVFGRMSQLAMDNLRTIGLAQANQHNALSNLVYTIWIDMPSSAVKPQKGKDVSTGTNNY